MLDRATICLQVPGVWDSLGAVVVCTTTMLLGWDEKRQADKRQAEQQQPQHTQQSQNEHSGSSGSSDKDANSERS